MDKKQKAQLVAYYGAGTESRTRTGVNPPDPKSGASANSAIPA